MEFAIHFHHVLNVSVPLIKWLQELQNLCHHLVALGLLQIVDAGLQECHQVTLEVNARIGFIMAIILCRKKKIVFLSVQE